MGSLDNVEDFDSSSAIYATLCRITDLSFVAATDTPIGFDGTLSKNGITHSTVTNNDEITIIFPGKYQITIEPQLDRTTGTSPEVVDTWIELDSGGGFAAIADTNIKRAAGGAGDTGVAPLTVTLNFNSNDKIRIVSRSTSADMILNATAAAGSVPATAACIINILRVGN
jgi:hypothetical protein